MSGQTLASILKEVRRRFSEAELPDAATDARVLLSGVLDISPTLFIADPARALTADEADRIERAVERRLRREPVHRILGWREFFGLELGLSEATLEPRPDTEILVEKALYYLQRKAKPRFVDFGTGTGAIALALLSACPDAQGVGVDLSEEALSTARANADRLGLGDRFSTVHSDWAEGVAGAFDLIVSNPPYIASAVVAGLSPEVRLYDPALALDGGTDGLDAYRALASQCGSLLAPHGIIALEIGYDQRASVTDIFEKQGFMLLEAARDLGNNDRVLVFEDRQNRAPLPTA